MAKNLWKSGRAARTDPREDGGDGSPSDEAPYEMVGTTLRHKREERGEDLRYVAQMLRIRYPYLKAIEDGKPDELPGPTYAVGFVRTYAEHLGLDSESLVQKFKEEAAGLQAKADLHFPAPLPEGKIPSGAVLIVAVLLAAGVYGVWMYLSSRDQQVAEIVPELPNQISEIIQGNPPVTPVTPVTPEAASEQTVAGMPPTAEVSPAEATPGQPAVPDTAATVATQAAQATPESETEQAGPQPDATASATEAVEATETVVATVAPTETSGEAASESGAAPEAAPEPAERSVDEIPAPPGANADPAAAREEETPAVATAAVEDPVPAGDEPEVAAAETGPEIERTPPRIYGGENQDARIVIHADADSWVEVRDGATNELLLTRVLFKGDKYQVPDRGGLTLLTGNAGGLRIVVDGTAVPVLGPLGAVRRNVLLEPGPLLDGASAGRGDTRAPRTQSQTSESDLPPR